MLMIAIVMLVFAYGRMTSVIGPKPFAMIAVGVAVIAGLQLAFIGDYSTMTLTNMLVGSLILYVAAVAAFGAGHALGRFLDRDKYV
jgi:hypothetical protein